MPEPLRQFCARSVVVEDAPRLTFPQDGAALAPLAGGIPARVERGTVPFNWLADGAPLVVGSYEREERLELLGPGFVTVSAVDAEERGARVTVEVT